MPDNKVKKNLEAEIAKKKLQEALRMGRNPATGMGGVKPKDDEEKKKKKKSVIESLKEFISGPKRVLDKAAK